jgi:AraC-like DNA-binding protein/ligand-binding sensor protein
MNNSGESRDKYERLLEKTIQLYNRNQLARISVHPLTELFQKTSSLYVSFTYSIHCSPYCNAAKSTSRGLRYCWKNKYLSIKKAVQSNEPYTGRCYLGITEVVVPVYWKGVPQCILYVGNLMLKEDYSIAEAWIKRAVKRTGSKKELLEDAIASIKVICREDLGEYVELGETIASIISLCMANRQTDTAKATVKPNGYSGIHWVIEQIMNHVDTYYYNDLKLSQIASLYFVHPQYLSRLFNKEVRMHFTEYVNRVRLEHAKRLLLESDESVLNIALSVGYNNVTYFNTVFKKHTRVTPRQYRITR